MFGVSSSEYLDYAMNNRAEWQEKGKEVVQEMIVKVKLIEHEAEKKRKEAEEKAAAEAQSQEKEGKADASTVSFTGSSGMMSFDSRASLGHLGPLQ